MPSRARLRDRVVAVTGASAGIGLRTTERAAAEGAAVAGLARRAGRLEDLADRIAAGGGRALVMSGDVTDPDQVRAFVQRAVEKFGRLDVMVANAGIGYHGTLDDTPIAVMRRLVDVNLMGTLFAARAALEVFRRQGTGHLIAVSSIVGRRAVAGTGVYASTKAAQAALIESLRAEFVGTRLRASVVYPISTETEFRDAIQRDYGRTATHHGPRQSADDVARAIVDCIVSPAAEVYPYRRSKLLAVMNVVAPVVTDRLIKRFGRTVVPPGTSDDPAGS